MLLGLGVGYQKLVGTTESNKAAVVEVRAAVSKVEEKSKETDIARATDIKLIQSDVQTLKTDTAVTAVKIGNIETKLSEQAIKINDVSTKLDQVIRQTR